jgi:RNA polymerase sigma factor (sigma-70 family)
MTGKRSWPSGSANPTRVPGGDQPGAASPTGAAWVVEVIGHFERPLTLYVSRIVRDDERARDVVQEAFLRLCLQPRDAVEPHLAEWLYTVCRNKALDVRRKEKRMTELTDQTADAWTSSEPGPAEAMEKSESAQRAAQLMEQLSDNQQEVLRLKFQHGLSYKQISRVTNLSVSNVGFLIHTGLKTLRQRMGLASEGR